MTYQRANTQWMAGSMGVSFHWTGSVCNLDGTAKSYQDSVRDFPVEMFADQLADAGVQHCIFTLTHAKQYFPFPIPFMDQLLPGRTSPKDMLMDLILALKKRNIRFIAYYNHSCNGNDDLPWKEICGYADGAGHDLNRFTDNICTIVRYISERYKDLISAWWFDSPYSLDPRGPFNSITCDIASWQFPWERLTAAAKTGNPEAAVAINGGILSDEGHSTSQFLYTDHVDYYPGECFDLQCGAQPEAVPGILESRWACADSPAWVFTRKLQEQYKGKFVPPQFSDEKLYEAFQQNLDAGRMITLNMLIDQAGTINPETLAQFKRIR